MVLRFISMRIPIGWRNNSAFTIVELTIAVSVAGILLAIAVPNYINYRYKAAVAATIAEIKLIEKKITRHVQDNAELPDSLADIGMNGLTDSWGNPFRYLRIDGGKTKGANGKQRRNGSAGPINSDYDLYSMGQDGKTSARFMAQKARDDIVRANDGGYYGLAEDHES